MSIAMAHPCSRNKEKSWIINTMKNKIPHLLSHRPLLRLEVDQCLRIQMLKVETQHGPTLRLRRYPRMNQSHLGHTGSGIMKMGKDRRGKAISGFVY